jgi:hypothetical protein
MANQPWSPGADGRGDQEKRGKIYPEGRSYFNTFFAVQGHAERKKLSYFQYVESIQRIGFDLACR